MDYLQSYKVMFYALEDYYFMTRNDILGGMLGFMSPELLYTGEPIDVSVLNDWESSIKNVTNSSLLSLEDCVNATIGFLSFYFSEFGYDVQWIIGDLREKPYLIDKWYRYFEQND